MAVRPFGIPLHTTPRTRKDAPDDVERRQGAFHAEGGTRMIPRQRIR